MTRLVDTPQSNPQTLLRLGRGKVWHARLSPVVNRFHYTSYFVLLPIRSLLAPTSRSVTFPYTGLDTPVGPTRLRWGPLSFDPRDHGTGSGNLLGWLDTILQEGGVHNADGELWLQTYPRVLGYAFKPVSFWFASDKSGVIQAVVAEVNNTFGERHCYLVKAPMMDGKTPVWTDKVFHVSPFCSVEGSYAFRFLWPRHGQSLKIEVDLFQRGRLVLQTGIGAKLVPLTPRIAWQAFWDVPLMTLFVVGRIHWQALRLAIKRVPFFRKPPPPTRTVT